MSTAVYALIGRGFPFDQLLNKLHNEEKVRGVTVFRGISGLGKSGRVHLSRLLDPSMNLPVVIEFFDEPDKVEAILERLNGILEPGHIVSWCARTND